MITELSKPSLSRTNEKSADSNTIQKPIVTRKAATTLNSEKREKTPIAPRVKPKPIPAFTLLSPMQSAEKRLIVGAREIDTIRLRVVHQNAREFVSYRVEIHAADGDLVWSREIAVNEKTLKKPLALDVRSNALASGLYELTLSGATSDAQFEEVNFYNFTVHRN